MSDQSLHAKGKAKAKQENNDDESAENSPSLSSRIANSASSLSRDLVNGGASSTTSALASSFAASGKAQQASDLASTSASSSTWAQRSSLSQYDATSIADHSSQRDNFRNFQSRNATSLDSELELGGYLSASHISPRQPLDVDYRVSSWTGQFRNEQASQSNSQVNELVAANDVAAAEEADGMEVVGLLNDSNALADEPMLEADIASAEDVSSDSLFYQPLSATEKEVRSRMEAALPSPTQFSPVDPLSVNNFRPNIEMLHMATPSASNKSPLSESLPIPIFLSEEHRNQWMSQWLDEWDGVLRNYTDEVWGTDLPQVEKARKEIEDMKKDQATWKDKQAVRRLQMILGHIKVPNTNG